MQTRMYPQIYMVFSGLVPSPWIAGARRTPRQCSRSYSDAARSIGAQGAACSEAPLGEVELPCAPLLPSASSGPKTDPLALERLQEAPRAFPPAGTAFTPSGNIITSDAAVCLRTAALRVLLDLGRQAPPRDCGACARATGLGGVRLGGIVRTGLVVGDPPN